MNTADLHDANILRVAMRCLLMKAFNVIANGASELLYVAFFPQSAVCLTTTFKQ